MIDNNYCSLPNFNNPNAWNFGQWDDWAKTTSPNRDVKVYIGAPAAPGAAGSGYVDAGTLGNIATQTRNQYSSFGGIMLWDASQAYGEQNHPRWGSHISLAPLQQQMAASILLSKTRSGGNPTPRRPQQARSRMSVGSGGIKIKGGGFDVNIYPRRPNLCVTTRHIYRAALWMSRPHIPAQQYGHLQDIVDEPATKRYGDIEDGPRCRRAVFLGKVPSGWFDSTCQTPAPNGIELGEVPTSTIYIKELPATPKYVRAPVLMMRIQSVSSCSFAARRWKRRRRRCWLVLIVNAKNISVCI